MFSILDAGPLFGNTPLIEPRSPSPNPTEDTDKEYSDSASEHDQIPIYGRPPMTPPKLDDPLSIKTEPRQNSPSTSSASINSSKSPTGDKPTMSPNLSIGPPYQAPHHLLPYLYPHGLYPGAHPAALQHLAQSLSSAHSHLTHSAAQMAQAHLSSSHQNASSLSHNLLFNQFALAAQAHHLFPHGYPNPLAHPSPPSTSPTSTSEPLSPLRNSSNLFKSDLLKPSHRFQPYNLSTTSSSSSPTTVPPSSLLSSSSLGCSAFEAVTPSSQKLSPNPNIRAVDSTDEDSHRTTPPPVSQSNSNQNVSSDLKSIENMVNGLERRQEQLNTGKLHDK